MIRDPVRISLMGSDTGPGGSSVALLGPILGAPMHLTRLMCTDTGALAGFALASTGLLALKLACAWAHACACASKTTQVSCIGP